MSWLLLLLLAIFPLVGSLLDLAGNLRSGLPADHLAAFAALAGVPWATAAQGSPGVARYVSLLESGYAVHELVFAIFFIAIVAIPFRRRERWAWWTCWAYLIANAVYSATFGRYDPVILRQSLIGDVALPLLLIVQMRAFFSGQSTRG